MKKSTESDLVRSCLKVLNQCGVFAWRNNAGAIPLKGGGFRRYAGLKGASDILGILPAPPSSRGIFLAVECKTATGRVSKEQQWFLDEVNARGGLGLIVRDVADLLSVLRDHKII